MIKCFCNICGDEVKGSYKGLYLRGNRDDGAHYDCGSINHLCDPCALILTTDFNRKIEGMKLAAKHSQTEVIDA